MSWFIAILLSALLFSVSNAMTKGFSPRLSLLTSLFVFALGTLFAAGLGLLISKSALIRYTADASPRALWGMAVSGFVWAWATYLFLLVISKNTALSLAIPILVGGIGVGGVVAGVLIFGESLTLARVIGIFVILGGSVLLARS